MNEIVALYKFVNVANPTDVQKRLKSRLKYLNIYGTILISHEGINGTISSNNPENLSSAVSFIESIKGFKKLDLKYSQSQKKPFVRLKVKLKKEIVTIGDQSINPNEDVGEYVMPEDWNDLIKDKDTIVIDTRNNYECSIGTFKNAINPKTDKFSDFPEWIKNQNFSDEERKNKKIAMFCTGGIRCEKSTAYMKEQGFEEVYHLEGGILKYLEEVPEEESMWEGDCYVFDGRVAVNHQLEKSGYEMCNACRLPITQEDMESEAFEKGVSCPKCIDKHTDEQKARFREREKQVQLANKRGETHVGGEADQVIAQRRKEKIARKDQQRKSK